MCLLNPKDPDIAFARDCVITTLTDIPDSYGAVFVIDDEQAHLAAMVQRNHERQRDALILEKARMLNRPGRRGRARKPSNVVDLTGKQVA